ncbi:MAG: extracellular solute-binding protein [Bacteroidota bacterium]
MRFTFFYMALMAAFVLSCSSGNTETSEKTTGNQVVNLYSQRHYDVDRKVYDKFEKETGIRVNMISAAADELLAKLKSEAELTSCDVFMAVDAGNLQKAKEAGVLQPLQSDILNKNIIPHLRDPEGYWFAQTMRARVFAVKKGLKDKYPNLSYEDIAKPEFRGKIVMRSSTSSYNQALLASIIAHDGEAAASAWAAGVTANFAREPKGNDRDQVKDIASGKGEITLVNTYYLGKMQKSDDAAEQKALQQVEIIFPNQQGRGTHINVSGSGLAKYAKNKANGIKLLEFLARPDIQKEFALNNEEYPVNGEFSANGILSKMGNFKIDSLNLELLGTYNPAAIKIFDKAGWQ